MPSRRVGLLSPVITTAGRFAAVLALIGQIVLGALVIPDDALAAQKSALAAASVLCAGGSHDPGGGTPHRPHAPDSALCPLSLALAAPAGVLTPVVMLPCTPRVLANATAAPPRARGPPARTPRVGSPRGPPSLA